MNSERNMGCFVLLAIVAALLLGGAFMLLQPGSLLGYWAWGVPSDEVAVQKDREVFKGLLGPGYYSAPFELGADLQNVSVKAIEFMVLDQQVLTRSGIDQQTLTVDVSFNVKRPGLGVPVFDAEGNQIFNVDGSPQLMNVLTEQRWQSYRGLLTNEDALRAYVNPAAAEAIRACFNATAFQEAVGGVGRDTLSTCITSRLTASLADAGITVERLLIANVDPSAAAMQRLEEIRDVNQQIDLANANAELVEAQALRDAEAERGKIYVTAAAVEAQYNAVATQAVAERAAIEAQRGVIDAQATNDASAANYERALSEINLQIAQLKAQADYADEATMATIYQQYPQYAYVITQRLLSESLANVQWGYLQPGQSPLTVITDSSGTLGYVVPSAPGFAPTATPPAQ